MHYGNGREAKNGDRVVLLSEDGKILASGFLYDAQAGNDFCNGRIAVPQHTDPYPNLKNCLHADDVAAVLKAGVPDSTKQG